MKTFDEICLERDYYRARATRAEQENAQLREELSKRPNYEWFVELIRKHLRAPDTAIPQHLAMQVKQLKDAKIARERKEKEKLVSAIDYNWWLS